MFATIFFGILDPAKGDLAWVGGGQEPPAVRRRDGTIERLAPTGPAVGAMPGMEFAAKTVVLAPGDLLLAFTDGVGGALALGQVLRRGQPGGAPRSGARGRRGSPRADRRRSPRPRGRHRARRRSHAARRALRRRMIHSRRATLAGVITDLTPQSPSRASRLHSAPRSASWPTPPTSTSGLPSPAETSSSSGTGRRTPGLGGQPVLSVSGVEFVVKLRGTFTR